MDDKFKNAVHYNLDGFPPKDIDMGELAILIGEANYAVGRLSSIIEQMDMPSSYLMLSTIREAFSTSRIEGSRAEDTDGMKIMAGDKKKYSKHLILDTEEVSCYIDAYLQAEQKLLAGGSVTKRLLCSSHKLLMSSERGKDKSPGKMRKVQNYVGRIYATGDFVPTYVPIAPERLNIAINRLLDFANKTENNPCDSLVRLAIIHAEFEALHPFLDGNGRMGRMLIPLLMHQCGLMGRPSFHMSVAIEFYRPIYYESLKNVSKENAWKNWCEFFLKAVILQAQNEMSFAKAIEELQKETEHQVSSLTPKYRLKVLEFIFCKPVFNSLIFSRKTGISKNSSLRIIDRMIEKGIIDTEEKSKRGKRGIYSFAKLVDIIENAALKKTGNLIYLN